MAMQVDLSIIIVNWNSVGCVRACLNSIRSMRHGLNLEVIVIDNASYDGCSDMVTCEFPEVRFIQSGTNMGFGAANNRGFMSSSGELVLFLNPDTEVSDRAIQRLVEVLQATSDAGIVGAKLLNSDGTVQTSCIQRFPTILNLLLDSDCLRTLMPRWSLWGVRPLLDKPDAAVEVDAISGACQMVRRDVFLQAQMYNTSYFMYVEDVDLCFKTKSLGLRNLYVPDATVVHHGSKSGEGHIESWRSAIMMREAWKRYFEQHRGASYARSFTVAVGIQAAVRLGLISVASLYGETLGRGQSFTNVRQKWIAIFRWALGREAWVSQLRTS
jgi:N-acetylglucosaminyl-diphospho-decaprenol L-rhamnosyltransferase